MAGNGISEEDHKHSMEAPSYRIRIKGHLDSSWSEWFEGLRMTCEEDGTTVLIGPVADQPALHGLLIKIRDLGLLLLSVSRVESDQGEALGQSN